MALVFADSFDHYVTADLLTKWTGSSLGNLIVTSAVSRFGGQAFSNPDNSGGGYLISPTFTSHATWIVGAAVYVEAVGLTDRPIFRLYDGATWQVDLRLNTARVLYVTRNSTVLGTGVTALSLNTWYYVEFKVTINSSTGTVDVRINGGAESGLALTSQNTQVSGNASANTLMIGAAANSITYRLDDLYLCDGSGSSPTNTFLGDVRVEAIYPSGDGNSSQLVGSDGNSTNNSLLVDETAPNSDTDYVESSTVGNKDTYAFGNVTPTAGTVYGVQVLPYAKKTDAGTRSIVSVARLSATEVDSAAKTLSTTYGYLPDVREAKPGGGTWSITDVNNAEFGVKISA